MFAFMLVASWETLIQIGIPPANSSYGALFEASAFPAALLDAAGTVVYRTAAWEDDAPERCDGRVRRSMPVPGGSLLWEEDRSAIRTALRHEGGRLLATLTDDGTVAPGAAEGGGLGLARRAAEDAAGSMRVRWEPSFELALDVADVDVADEDRDSATDAAGGAAGRATDRACGTGAVGENPRRGADIDQGGH